MRTPIAKRVLLVGWADADWQTLRPLLDRGTMPALASLVEAGVCGNVAPVQPAISSMLWTSVASGKRADKHGICSVFEPLPDRSGFHLVSSASRQCQAVWNILTAAELNSQVIGWPASAPAEAILGAIVSDRFFERSHYGLDAIAADDADDSCFPRLLERELMGLAVKPEDLTLQDLAPFFPRSASEIGGAARHALELSHAISAISSVHAVACRQLTNEPWDFAAVLYPSISSWSELPLSDHCHEAVWRYQDELLSTLLKLAGDDATIVLVSPCPTAGGPPRRSEAPVPPRATVGRFGMACLAGPGIIPKATLQGGTVLDVTPTILSLFGLPVGDDMDGWPWRQVLQGSPAIRRTPTWDLIAEMRKAPSSEAPSISSSPIATLPAPVGTPACEIILRNQRINLALALDDSNRASSAIRHWKELAADFPEDVFLSLRLLSALMNDGELGESRQLISKMPPAIAQMPQVQFALADLAIHDGDVDTALRIANDQAKKHSSSPRVLNQAGHLLLKCQAWNNAECVFLASLRTQADNPIARNGLSTVYWEQDRYPEAIREVRHALASVPAFPQARFNLGKSLQSLGNDAEAIEAFEYCVSLNYQPQEAHGRLAALYRFHDPVRAQQHQLRSGVC